MVAENYFIPRARHAAGECLSDSAGANNSDLHAAMLFIELRELEVAVSLSS